MSNLGGHLVGYGIGKNEKVEFTWLKNPIHNRIVEKGIKNLFLLDIHDNYSSTNYVKTANSLPALWTDQKDPNHSGVIEYCAYGTKAGRTSYFDENLGNRISDYINTKYTKIPYCGSSYDIKDGIITFHYRVSHLFPVVTETTEINEVGWFAKNTVNDEDEYIMFSRVGLNEPVILKPNEYLIVTYQIDESVNVEQHNMYSASQFSAGSNIYEQKLCKCRGTGWNCVFNRPCIDTNGNTPTLNLSGGFMDDYYFFASFRPAYFTKGNLPNSIGTKIIASTYTAASGYNTLQEVDYTMPIFLRNYFKKMNDQVIHSAGGYGFDYYYQNKAGTSTYSTKFTFGYSLSDDTVDVSCLKYEENSFERKSKFNFQVSGNTNCCLYLHNGIIWCGAFKNNVQYVFKISYDTEDTIAIKQGTFVD